MKNYTCTMSDEYTAETSRLIREQKEKDVREGRTGDVMTEMYLEDTVARELQEILHEHHAPDLVHAFGISNDKMSQLVFESGADSTTSLGGVIVSNGNLRYMGRRLVVSDRYKKRAECIGKFQYEHILNAAGDRVQ